MRNRAKCKLCHSIIESFHRYDMVTCKCGEIAVDGGQDTFRSIVKDFKNFIRIDDMDNEIIPKIIEKDEDVNPLYIEGSKPTKSDLMKMLDEMIKNYENLPDNAMSTPITHYDFCSSLLLISSILRATD